MPNGALMHCKCAAEVFVDKIQGYDPSGVMGLLFHSQLHAGLLITICFTARRIAAYSVLCIVVPNVH